MTQEDKELLIKDMCSRLPYGVQILYDSDKKFNSGLICQPYGLTIYNGRTCALAFGVVDPIEIDEFKLCLRPMSSMTDEEFIKLKEYSELKYDQLDLASFQNGTYKCLDFYLNEVPADVVVLVFDWLNKNHFDYRGLIERGLAIEITNIVNNE